MDAKYSGAELEVTLSKTVGETNKLYSFHRKVQKQAQELIIKSFGFKKVDKHFLELKLGNNLLELNVYAMTDEVNYSLRYWHDHTNDLLYRGKSLENTYFVIKAFIKKQRKKQQELN